MEIPVGLSRIHKLDQRKTIFLVRNRQLRGTSSITASLTQKPAVCTFFFFSRVVPRCIGSFIIWPWLVKFNEDFNELFHVFSLDYFHGSITRKSGRIAHTVVQGTPSSETVDDNHLLSLPQIKKFVNSPFQVSLLLFFFFFVCVCVCGFFFNFFFLIA